MKHSDDVRASARSGLRSMTGHGRGEAESGAYKAVVEVGSVNRRQLDIRLQLPRCLALRESFFSGLIRERLSRGHVTASLCLSSSNDSAAHLVNLNGIYGERVHSAIEALRAVAADLGLRDDLCASHLLQLTAMQYDDHPKRVHPDAEQASEAALTAALDALCAMRSEEGACLKRDLTERFEGLGARLNVISEFAPGVTHAYRELMERRLREGGHAAALEDEALRRELLLFASRSDIAEEITRLRSHLAQADEFLSKGGTIGRTLEFLLQEISREINTLGAKASDARISREVVGFKTELDRIREQTLNLE